jgi:hypothetical protein
LERLWIAKSKEFVRGRECVEGERDKKMENRRVKEWEKEKEEVRV